MTFRKLSKAQTLNANQRALDQLAILSGKPRVVLHTMTEKRGQRPRSVDAPPLEHQEQVRVVQFWGWYAPTRGLDRLQLVAIPNSQMLIWAAKNPPAAINYLKAEGMRPGAQDLVLFVQRPPYGALLIEMKRTVGGVVSEDQEKMRVALSAAGYKCVVCRGADAAISVIREYVEG